MPCIHVEISRFVDAQFPGFVECRLVDAHGAEHLFVEKSPVVSASSQGIGDIYPQPGTIACMIEQEWIDEFGRSLVLVNMDLPWGIESLDGQSVLTLLAAQVGKV